VTGKGRAGVALAVLMVLCAPPPAGGGWLDKIKKAVDVGEDVAAANVHIGEAQERAIGRAVAANLMSRFGLVEDEELTLYVSLVGNYLASLSGRPELPYRFAILDTDEINGYAAPGGYIFITRGALKAMRDESELAGLLAHEVMHVAERHGVRAIENSYRTKYIVSGLGEATAGSGALDPNVLAVFGELAEEATETLLTKGLSRKVELKADKGALDLLWRAGYDPEGLVRFLERLAAPGYERPQPTLMRTHPKPDQRAAKAGKALAAMSAGPRPEARFAQLFSAEVARPGK